MKRRKFIILLGGAASWSLAARAQQARMPLVGFLSGRSPVESAYLVSAFREGLRETGYIEGQNLEVEYRWAEGQLDRVPRLAAELVQHRVDAIVAVGGSDLEVVRSIKTIPIVFNAGADPVDAGLVSSLNRPTGNATGVTAFYYALETKRLEILRELDRGKMVGVFMRTNAPSADVRAKDVQRAALALGMQVQIFHVDSAREIELAFEALVKLKVGALLVSADPFFNSRRDQLVALSAKYKIPALFHSREFALAGGLMSYGASIADAYKQIGIYVGRILKGTKPSELPVQQSALVELVVNLKTAKTLGVDVPTAILLRADEVIE
jgi:putative ABC transport system substrate-binding protein